MRRLARALALASLVTAPAASGEIYRWTDAQGEHFTEDLNQVPPASRPRAKLGVGSPSGRGAVQTYESPARGPAASLHSAAVSRGAGAVQMTRIPLQRLGTALFVQVRLNDRVVVPIQVDTGASDVVLPRTVADALGLRLGPDVRRVRYATANGFVDQPVVMLESVDLGGARVEGVPATVSDSMSTGLLGLSFFNHFTYQIDAVSGVLALVPNGLAESGLIRGGRSEAQWRAQFDNLRARMEMLGAPADGDPTSTVSARADGERQRLEHEMDQLEDEADQARVPAAWRE